jgi:hypothetical protein
MAGMLNEIMARQHVQELLRKAEEQRRGAGPSTDRSRARMLLHVLLTRRGRGLERGGRGTTTLECRGDVPCSYQ